LNKKKQQSLLININTTIVISISFWLHLIIFFSDVKWSMFIGAIKSGFSFVGPFLYFSCFVSFGFPSRVFSPSFAGVIRSRLDE